MHHSSLSPYLIQNLLVFPLPLHLQLKSFRNLAASSSSSAAASNLPNLPLRCGLRDVICPSNQPAAVPRVTASLRFNCKTSRSGKKRSLPSRVSLKHEQVVPRTNPPPPTHQGLDSARSSKSCGCVSGCWGARELHVPFKKQFVLKRNAAACRRSGHNVQ